MRFSCDVLCTESCAPLHSQGALIELLNVDADIPQLVNNTRQVFRLTILNFQFAVGYRGSDNKRSGLNAVRNNRVLRATKRFHAVDLDSRGTPAAHARSHPVQQLAEIADLWFASGVINYCLTASERRRHHQVLGASDRDLIKRHCSAD